MTRSLTAPARHVRWFHLPSKADVIGGELVRALMQEPSLLPCQVRHRRSLTVEAVAGPIPDLGGRDFTAAISANISASLSVGGNTRMSRLIS